jgi:mannose-6-phosphate isomerase-like protein (cupin superfamily)
LIKKSERVKHVNSPACIAYAYEHKDKDINIAFIEIKGRYPDKGSVLNKVCKELIFIIKGRGKVGINNKKFSIKEGDSVLIQPNQKYFLQGKLDTVVCCHPTWYSEQHVECD